MAKKLHFLLVVAAATLVATAAVPRVPVSSLVNTKSRPVTVKTVYDMLEKYGFPRGILPAGAQGYTVNPDGSFEVDLPADCEVDIAGYRLWYRSHIYGNVQNGEISKLDGVSVKVLLSWVGIHDVVRSGDEIKFHAGSIVSKSSPVSDFTRSPTCQ